MTEEICTAKILHNPISAKGKCMFKRGDCEPSTLI